MLYVFAGAEILQRLRTFEILGCYCNGMYTSIVEERVCLSIASRRTNCFCWYRRPFSYGLLLSGYIVYI